MPGLWGCTTGRTGLGGWGVQPRGWSGHPSGPMGGHHLRRTGRTGLGGTGSPGQGVVGASCRAHGEASSANNRAHRPWGGRGAQPRGWSEPPARPMGSHHLPITGRTGLGGTGSPARGVVGASCQGQWGAIFFREPGAPARGGRGVLPRGCSESLARPRGGASSLENRAHRPGGDGESCPGGVRSLLPGQWGAIFFREPGAPARGGRGVLPRGCSESPARPRGGHLLQRTGRTGPGGTGSPAQGVFGVSCQANGGPSFSENRAHRPGGDGESCPGGVRSLLPSQWGAIFFREPGAPARGGQGVLPRGCSESPARPRGGHLLQRTGRTGLGGTGSPAQGVFGISCQAKGGPSSSENRAHRPGGDGESCPGGVRSLLQGQWGAIFLGHRADKGSVASNRHHQRGHTALPALSCRLHSGRLGKAGLAGRGVVFEAPRACLGHRPSRLCGAAPLSQPPVVPLNLTPTHTPCIPLLALLRH